MADERSETVWLSPLYVNKDGATVEVGVDAAGEPDWWVRAGGEAVAPHADGRLLLPLMQPGYGGDHAHARRMICLLYTSPSPRD